MKRGTFAVANFDGHNISIIKENNTRIETLYSVNEKSVDSIASPDSNCLARELKRRGLKLVLRLSPDLGIKIIDKLPSVALRDLRAILSNRLDNLTPWTAEAAVFETLHVYMPSDGVLQVEIVVVPRKTIARANSMLAHMDVVADLVDLESGDMLAAPTYNLCHAERLPQIPRYIVVGAGFLLASSLIFGSYIGFNISQEKIVIRQNQNYEALLESRLVDLKTLNDRVRIIVEEDQFVRELRLRRPSILIAIESLSQALPDGTWLETLTLTDQKLTLSGYAQDANLLPALIEAIPIFEAVRFTSPSERTILAAESGEPIEAVRFSLQMTVQAARNPEP